MRPLNSRLGIGVLGLSDIACRRFIPAIPRADASLVAIGRRDPNSRAGMDASLTGIPTCSYEALLACPQVELVYISLPNDLHEEWACRALTAGKHVLCEKPLAPSMTGVTRMLDVANRSGKLLFENVMFLHHPQHQAVKEMVEGGAVGSLRLLRAVFGFSLSPTVGNFRLDAARGGGVIADLLIYPVATAEFFGMPVLFDPCGLVFHDNGIDIAGHGTAHDGTGIGLTFTVSFRQHYESYYELIGDMGTLRLDRAYTTPAEVSNRLHRRTSRENTLHVLPAADHFAETIRHVTQLLHASPNYASTHAALLRRHQTLEQVKSALHPIFTQAGQVHS